MRPCSERSGTPPSAGSDARVARVPTDSEENGVPQCSVCERP